MRRLSFIPLAAAALTLSVSSAHASLIYLGTTEQVGTGLGAVSTVLTVQSPANSTTETGGVAAGAGGARVVSGDALTGASQSVLRTFGEVGLTSAAELRIVFNVAEPGAVAQGDITLTNLALNLYGPSGNLLFNSGAFTPVTFTAAQVSAQPGIGNAGFVFGLDAAQANDAQQRAFSGSFAANLIGLTATATNAQGGPETFFVARERGLGGGGGGGGGGGQVPLPGTIALLGVGLIALGMRRKSV